MNIIIHSKSLRGAGHIAFSHRKTSAVMLFFVILIPAVMMFAGFKVGESTAVQTPSEISLSLRQELDSQRNLVEETKQSAQENVNALAMRLGQMQAQMIRLDALGERLTKMAKLDRGEFDFGKPPAQGGPVNDDSLTSIAIPDFLSAIDRLSKQLDDRSQQLGVLESLLMNRNLQAEVLPAGRPIKRGWTSSFYGMRTDPFTGKQEHHKGMDFAGRDGSDIVAVASGVITWAGKRYGYGNLVEVNHGNGYVTRYGHCKDMKVNVGETVKKGQLIALMGSTGRSTGPHVHFEVWRNGRPVDPERYIKLAYR
ncbi:MAG: M23 family metallopeptidase [Gammaproteobacteria bacterium]|nr:M23 family metallopeptidase [Gammaproteobacteria bacterium]